MEVFKKTVSAVFGGERRYLIPLFQRPYVWTRENQWEPLWEDIQEKADAEAHTPSVDAPPHFLGAIVIQQRQSWGDELLAHDVIDGQQRLTTLQLLLAAFRDLALQIDDRQLVASLDSWTKNSNPIADPDVEQFKLYPTGRDIEQFRLVTTARSRPGVEAVHPPVVKRRRLQPRPRMVEAYLYFHEAIEGWLKAEGPEQVAPRARILRRALDRRMQFVSIELERLEDPQAIFETLNARGVPLLASDLLRNFVFQRAGKQEEAERLHAKHWARFEAPDDPNVPDGDRFWEVEERQGRLSRARLDLFVQHYLSMKRESDVGAGRLFPEYKSWIESSPFETLEAELVDFTRYADVFAKLVRPPADAAFSTFATRLRALDNSTVYPLVLGLLGDTSLPDTERARIFTDLESFLVRRLICGRPTKNYNRSFLQLLRDFRAGPRTHEAFRALLAAGTGETVDWPGDAAFEQAWTTIDAYRDLKPARVEMLLRAVEGALQTGDTERVTIHGKLTVEHVLPQEWKEHWPLPAELDEEAAIEARDMVLHDFGNLTLLTQPLNSKVSNGPASEKLPKIAMQSALRLNTYFQGRSSWGEGEIGERGAVLFATAKKVWPGPT